MKLESISIDSFRSIQSISIRVPKSRPLVLFGPNNAGKSNIISAVNRILGERYAPYIDMLDSDFYMRDKERYSQARIGCGFDQPYYTDRCGNCFNSVFVEYNKNTEENCYASAAGTKLYISNDDRSQIQAYVINAEREISYQFSYSSRFTLLSKFSHAIHEALSTSDKDQLSDAFEEIKGVFASTSEFASFFDAFQSTISDSVKGFVHGLEVDFSAYDPNNYANSMRILAKEGESTRSFSEFGTGEQQVLLMAFAKSYMEVFGTESLVLVLEEPEAHLHPLAQRWLKKYIYDLCESEVQVILSTHSADFLDPSNLEGLVRVFKTDDGVTNVVQLSSHELMAQCIADGASEQKISEIGIGDFYAAKLMPDSLKGLFASRVLLVEGATEFFALPIYFEKAGFTMSAHGLDIVSCGGKTQIPSYARLFKAYGIECFCLFDADTKSGDNKELMALLGISDINESCAITVGSNYSYFGKDFETTIREDISNYSEFELIARQVYKVSGKPAVARVAACLAETESDSINKIIKLLKSGGGSASCEDDSIGDFFGTASPDDDIPF